VPPPEVAIDIPQDAAQSTAITDVTDRPVPMAPPPPPPPKQVKKASIDSKRFPPSEEYYPAASKRLGEEGSPTVKVCVGPQGKLSEEPSIATSSGNTRLDEAAIKYAKAGRYLAGSVDGQPTTDCLVFRVKFELKN
jgi:protein TonB